MYLLKCIVIVYTLPLFASAFVVFELSITFTLMLLMLNDIRSFPFL